MSQAPRFAGIGAGGWLGRALVRAALDRGVISAETSVVTARSGRSDAFAGYPALRLTADNRAAADGADVVLLSVRPGDLDGIALDLRDKLVISVMAMVPVEMLRQRFGASRIIRAMPNAAAEHGLSYTPMYLSPETSEQDLRFSSAFFAASGMVDAVETEALLDYLTGLTGSGPAFFASLAAAMERHAVTRGLPPEMAARAIGQLLKGAASELGGTRSPGALVAAFMAYRGTTAAGLEAMQQAGLDNVVAAMLEAAEARARGR